MRYGDARRAWRLGATRLKLTAGPAEIMTQEMLAVSDAEAFALNRAKIRRRWEAGAAIVALGVLAAMFVAFCSILSN